MPCFVDGETACSRNGRSLYRADRALSCCRLDISSHAPCSDQEVRLTQISLPIALLLTTPHLKRAAQIFSTNRSLTGNCLRFAAGIPQSIRRFGEPIFNFTDHTVTGLSLEGRALRTPTTQPPCGADDFFTDSNIAGHPSPSDSPYGGKPRFFSINREMSGELSAVMFRAAIAKLFSDQSHFD